MSEKKEIKKTPKEREQSYLLLGPQISEKATLLAESGFYTFKVEKKANKNRVRKEVEKKYKVDVTDVQIINIPSRKRRVGRIEGKRGGYKKAVVKVKGGQSIDLTLS